MLTVINAHIEPSLGMREISKLRRSHVEQWFRQLADKGPRKRVKKGHEPQCRAYPTTPEGTRRRRATANRCFAVLKAALNHAFQCRRCLSQDAWASVKPFRNVDSPIVRYLSEAEVRRLVNACGSEFRPFVKAALLTGCRYSELAALQARDFNADTGTLAIRTSKSGKPRHVVLTDEAQRFFAAATAGKIGLALILTRDDGRLT